MAILGNAVLEPGVPYLNIGCGFSSPESLLSIARSGALGWNYEGQESEDYCSARTGNWVPAVDARFGLEEVSEF